MNTLSDTDEGRARPYIGPIWPVWIVCVVLLSLLMSVDFLAEAFGLIDDYYVKGPEEVLSPISLTSLISLVGLFLGAALGWLAVWGVAKLRAWGWWCAAIWIGGLLVRTLLLIRGSPWSLFGTVLLLNMYAILVWPLIAWRRLFFPPKAEGEK